MSKGMSRSELSRLFKHVASLIESGDSLEGSLTYAIRPIVDDIGEFAVEAAFRTGNGAGPGSGSVTLIGHDT